MVLKRSFMGYNIKEVDDYFEKTIVSQNTEIELLKKDLNKIIYDNSIFQQTIDELNSKQETLEKYGSS